MTVAILETGGPPASLTGRYPGYGRMVADLVGPGHAYAHFAVAAGEWPADPGAHAAYVITGSAAGVYDPLPWIAELIAFLNRVPRKTPIVGICFGHQVMAAAFGGRVEKSMKGWGLGLHHYDIAERAPWMDDAARIAVVAIHQDQVVEAPATARTLAGNAFTPHGILAYTDRRAISFQVHPEFGPDYAADLIAGHTPTVPHEAAFRAAALASLDVETDAARLGGWIRHFLAEPPEIDPIR